MNTPEDDDSISSDIDMITEDASYTENEKGGYVLTIYKIVLEQISIVQFISFLKKNYILTPKNDGYTILKNQEQIPIKLFLEKRAKKIYNNILCNGGWDKCHIVEICRCICISLEEANKIVNKQIKVVSKLNNITTRFECQTCKYATNLECHWIRHETGKKHMEKLQIKQTKQIKADATKYMCGLCENVYMSRTSLWKHKKECAIIMDNKLSHVFIDMDKPYIETQQDVITGLLIQNETLIAGIKELAAEVKEQNAKIAELSKQPTTVIHNNNQNNFNLNFFLNETCKGAMSLSQFIESLQINLETVEYTGTNGYVAGISKIFMDGLRQLEVNMRPIHCTDLKRETLYIKDTDGWEKDNPEKSKFDNALDIVVRRNVQQVREWVNQNPRCDIIDSREYQLHINIMTQCLGGFENEAANNRKIRKMVAKEVFIKKKAEPI